MHKSVVKITCCLVVLACSLTGADDRGSTGPAQGGKPAVAAPAAIALTREQARARLRALDVGALALSSHEALARSAQQASVRGYLRRCGPDAVSASVLLRRERIRQAMVSREAQREQREERRRQRRSLLREFVQEERRRESLEERRRERIRASGRKPLGGNQATFGQ